MTTVVDLLDVPVRFEMSDGLHEAAVDAVIGVLPRASSGASLVVRFDRDRVPLPDGAHDHADGDVRAWWRGDRLVLAHGSSTAEVGPSSAHVGAVEDLDRAFRQLFPYVATHLLTSHDRFVLHGGAIRDGERAALVLGGTGSGKSTTVVSALVGGWRVLADDLVGVRLGPDGAQVRGITKPLAVPAEIVRDAGVEARPIVGDPRGRWRVQVAEEQPAWFPVASTIVTAHDATNDGGRHRLTSSQLFEWLLYAFLGRHDPDRLRRYLPVAAAVACQRGWELGLAADPTQRSARIRARLDGIFDTDPLG